MEAVERAIEAEAPCSEVLNLVASIRGAMNGLTAELIEDHVREHIVSAPDEAARRSGVDELFNVVRTYLK